MLQKYVYYVTIIYLDMNKDKIIFKALHYLNSLRIISLLYRLGNYNIFFKFKQIFKNNYIFISCLE